MILLKKYKTKCSIITCDHDERADNAWKLQIETNENASHVLPVAAIYFVAFIDDLACVAVVVVVVVVVVVLDLG